MNKLITFRNILNLEKKCMNKSYIHIKNANTSRSFLDSQSTTMIDPRVLDKMLPFMTYLFGNPHSRSHYFGWETEQAIENSRNIIKNAINANNSQEIIFTSGATESNNLVIQGIASYYNNLNKNKNHIITTQIEHKCVLQTCRYLQTKGFNVTYIKPNNKGLINIEDIEKNITDNTLLVSVIFVNNEIGVIQNIKEIGELCKKYNILFHTDASQGFGKINIDVNDMNIHLMSFSSHKIYGPKGIGALYIKKKKPIIRLNSIIKGGGQEKGLRSGTLPTELIVGFGEATKIAMEEMNRDNLKMIKYYNYLKNYLDKNLDFIIYNGCQINRYFGNMNVSFLFVEGESLLMELNQIALSSGSACTSNSLEPSYVLRSIGVSEDISHTSIRIGFNRFTTFDEVKKLAVSLVKSVRRLREMSPLYELEMEKLETNKKDKKEQAFIWT